jgi:GNAT superfamily N-acetyltransferase
MMQEKISLRPADHPQDYPQIAALLNTVWPEPVTAAMMVEWLERKPADQVEVWQVAVTPAGQIIGYAEVIRQPWKPAGHVWLWIVVDPAWRNQGIGQRLYDQAVIAAQTLGATTLLSNAYEAQPTGWRFAEKQGFVIERREFESSLDLSSFDEQSFAGVVGAVATTGIRFASLAALGDTDATRRQFYALNRATTLDVPGSDGTFPSFEQSMQWHFQASWFLPAGLIFALDGDMFVGFCLVGYYVESNSMFNFMTGVNRAYRGRHIALALKLLAIRFAKAYGAAYIRTGNDSENAPMLAINRKLGYQPLPGAYQLTKHLASLG